MRIPAIFKWLMKVKSLQSNCFICDDTVGSPVMYIVLYPVCSERCQKIWLDLTDSERIHYIECMNKIHAYDNLLNGEEVLHLG